jgi:hypothetical protein
VCEIDEKDEGEIEIKSIKRAKDLEQRVIFDDFSDDEKFRGEKRRKVAEKVE